MNSFLVTFGALLGFAFLSPALAKSQKPAARPIASPKAASKRTATFKRNTPKTSKPRGTSRGTSRVSGHTRRGARFRRSSQRARVAPAPTWRSRQLVPSSDRYREIQEALATKGYLKSAPTGSWDVASQEALKHFQADQHIQQTGTLNSISLIALGLGPAKSSTPPEISPAPNSTPSEPPQ